MHLLAVAVWVHRAELAFGNINLLVPGTAVVHVAAPGAIVLEKRFDFPDLGVVEQSWHHAIAHVAELLALSVGDQGRGKRIHVHRYSGGV